MGFSDAFADVSEDNNGGSPKGKRKCIVCDQDDHGIQYGIHFIHWCKVKSVVVWTLCSLLHCGLVWALAHVRLPVPYWHPFAEAHQWTFLTKSWHQVHREPAPPKADVWFSCRLNMLVWYLWKYRSIVSEFRSIMFEDCQHVYGVTSRLWTTWAIIGVCFFSHRYGCY